jgi:hypothetical protein
LSSGKRADQAGTEDDGNERSARSRRIGEAVSQTIEDRWEEIGGLLGALIRRPRGARAAQRAPRTTDAR